MNNDLTKGKPFPTMLKYMLPMFLSVFFQQFYSVTDSVIAGRYAGQEALAAIGASFPITMIFMAVATGSNIGCTVVISQFFGGKQYSRLKTAAFTALIFGSILSLLLTIVAIVFSSNLLNLISTPSDIFDSAKIYMNIYLGGFVFLYLYNLCQGIFNAMGDSLTPLLLLICSSVINVVLDYVFVAILKMGVAGAAWATLIAQGVCGFLTICVLLRRILKIDGKKDKLKIWSSPLLWTILAVALPSIFQQSFVSVGNFFIQSLINSQGAAVIAGFSAAFKLNLFALSFVNVVCAGVSAFTAQCVGAGKFSRIKKGLWSGLAIFLIIITPFYILYLIFPTQLAKMFVESGTGQETIDVAVEFLTIITPFYLAVGLKIVLDGVLRGTKSIILFMITTFSDLILRVIMAFVLFGYYGTKGIWYAWPVGWSFCFVISIVFYFSGIWKRKFKDIIDIKTL